ncbi:type VII toxin-antitoxin system MntA family adenylyltransferase antitoxin [Halanaerobacter jeridensis]|uniref:Nucleotidyltransferase n=1 Tax=Halanaerobacter jeridensis TaxID=706427 RepID=A0A938XPP1_9FIRM|nr:nucleotidyltransferase domain-containing protein [Halanaerobacter jeridensis]MBM7557338.1 putative nucleotidyltransferase [Halanaerobacter jeridensis]
MIDKSNVKKIIKEYCAKNKNIIAVYLFGSLARGTFSKNSDIDLSLMVNRELNKMEKFNLKLEVAVDLEELLDREVDIIIFSNADLRLKHQIIKGELILGKNNKLRVREESKAVSEYLDMKYFYDKYEEELGKGFLNG